MKYSNNTWVLDWTFIKTSPTEPVGPELRTAIHLATLIGMVFSKIKELTTSIIVSETELSFEVLESLMLSCAHEEGVLDGGVNELYIEFLSGWRGFELVINRKNGDQALVIILLPFKEMKDISQIIGKKYNFDEEMLNMFPAARTRLRF